MQNFAMSRAGGFIINAVLVGVMCFGIHFFTQRLNTEETLLFGIIIILVVRR